MPAATRSDPQSQSGCLGVIIRIIWLAGGNLIMALCMILVVVDKIPFPSLYDALYFACVIGLIVVRFIDIRFMHGDTSEGEPANMGHWKRYVLLLLPVSAGIWGAARIIVFYLKG